MQTVREDDSQQRVAIGRLGLPNVIEPELAKGLLKLFAQFSPIGDGKEVDAAHTATLADPPTVLPAALGAVTHVIPVLRTLKNADAIEGYVVGLGKHWVLIHRLSDFQFDGWVALRLNTVGRVEPRGADGVIQRVLDLRGLQPQTIDLRLGSTKGVIASGARRFPLVAVWREERKPNSFIVGWPVNIGKKRLSIFGVTPQAEWEDEPYRRRLDAITRVDLGTDYEIGLHQLAGFPPVS